MWTQLRQQAGRFTIQAGKGVIELMYKVRTQYFDIIQSVMGALLKSVPAADRSDASGAVESATPLPPAPGNASVDQQLPPQLAARRGCLCQHIKIRCQDGSAVTHIQSGGETAGDNRRIRYHWLQVQQGVSS